jgi:electron transport complex protein RnfG
MENTDIQNEPTLGQSILKNAIGLALFAFITAGVIAIVQSTTKDTIELNIAKAKAKALYEIVPQSSVDNDVLIDSIALMSENAKKRMNINLLGPLDEEATLHYAKKDGKVHTIILPAIAPDGYTTAIRLLVGIRLDGSVSGVRIVDHKETPGLGDKVELKKSNWVLSFNDRSLIDPDIDRWKVKKDGGEFDQFTGATITPRAVVDAVKRSLEFYQQYKSTILELAPQNLNESTPNQPASQKEEA